MTVTVADAMNLPIMQQAKLVAGRSGLSRQIRWVTIVEVIEDVTRLQEGEFLITTAYGWETETHRGRTLIEGFAAQKLSGVAIQTGFYLRSIPAPLVELANQLELPIFELSSELNFSMVTRELLEQVVNEQFRALEYSENVHRKLIHLALANHGLDSVASELAQLTHSVIQIYDSRWEVKAEEWADMSDDYGHFGLVYSDLREQVHRELRKNTAGVADKLNQQRTITLRLEGKEGSSAAQAAATNTGQNTLEAAIAPIAGGDDTLGYLLLAKTGHVTDLDLLALGHASTVCALEFMKQQAIRDAEQRLRADYLAELLQGHPSLLPAQLERAASFGLDKTKPHTVAIIQRSAQSAHSLEQLWAGIERTLTQRRTKFLAKQGLDSVLLLLEHAVDTEVHELMKQSVSAQVRGRDVRIGLGSAKQDLEMLSDSAKEAELAIRYGGVLREDDGVVCYRDLTPYRLFIDLHQQGTALTPYYLDLLKPLLEKPYLLQTLEVLLWNNMNLKDTAEILYIHRHTLKYRLQKIERETKKQLANPHHRFELQTAMVAYKVEHAPTERTQKTAELESTEFAADEEE